MHTEFWWGNLKGGGQLENLGVDGFIQLKRFLNKLTGRTWTGLHWLCIKCFHGGFVEDLRVLGRNLVSFR
jgi:hypothetical protein